MSISWIGTNEVLAALNKFTPETEIKIKELYQQAQEGTYQDSQSDVPVAAINGGTLKGSGRTPVNDSGSEFEYDVTYGGDGGQVYNYSSSTSQYSDGGVEADGYAFFQEEGTKYIAAQPYLGANFDRRVQGLLADLENIV